MKRLIPAASVLLLFLTLGSSKAHAQRSGSLQVTAQVVDSRAAWSGLESARSLAADWAQDPAHSSETQTTYAQISMISTAPLESAGRPEPQLEIRVDYLRN